MATGSVSNVARPPLEIPNWGESSAPLLMGLLAALATSELDYAEQMVNTAEAHTQRAQSLGELTAVLTELDGLIGTSTKPLSSLAADDKARAQTLIYKANWLLVECGYSFVLGGDGKPIGFYDDPNQGNLSLNSMNAVMGPAPAALEQASKDAEAEAWTRVRVLAAGAKELEWSFPIFETTEEKLLRGIATLGLEMGIPGAPQRDPPTFEDAMWWVKFQLSGSIFGGITDTNTQWAQFMAAYPERKAAILSNGSSAEKSALASVESWLQRYRSESLSVKLAALEKKPISMGLSLDDDAPTIKACLIQVRADADIRSQLYSSKSQSAGQAFSLSNAWLEACKNVLDQLTRTLSALIR